MPSLGIQSPPASDAHKCFVLRCFRSRFKAGASTSRADRLAGLRNELLAQRANDLRDVGLRVLSILTGEELRQPEYKPNTILIAKI